ncbi:MAG: beta-galactosidase [Bacteroidetes bacterium]|nr:beta-galactosidase [Bacteroidota bacterium]
MKRTIITILSVLLLISCKQNDPSIFYVNGVSDPIINLNGTWKVNINPPEKFLELDELNEKWKDIQVPGECMMQGFPIKHDKPFVFKKRINIPDDFSEKIIVLQFDGVYSYARVWINGNYVRDHSGGFTTWQCDITSVVKPGEAAMLTVEITDRADEISYASGYAKHQIGGILRNVSLLALPVNYPENITIKTDLDENFQHASLIISGKTKNLSDNSKITIELFDNNNKKINLENASVPLSTVQAFQITNDINNPKKWDAEHPNLYSLRMSFSEDDKLLWQKVYNIGFREITLHGNKLFVNGKEVKLRGACRHDIHPLLGRVSTPEYELKDVILAKDANMNFIRTSHYPPTDNFLQLCDKYGLYVEDETAVCFVGSHRTEEYYPGSTENDSVFTDRYLSQLKELLNSHKNHPSVIVWSVGNENSFGTNFKASYDLVKKNDSTRPVIFSYPGNVPDSVKCYDILSMHYPGTNGNMNQIGKQTNNFGHSQMPVIFDEWAHVACYNNFTIKEDPNIRSFWGISLDSMWQKTFDADGGLGGAIWGMIDETFMLPDSLPGYNEWWGKIDKNVIPAEYSGHTIGYGEWGIIDTWRRKKPEFWNTKKAYSPAKLLKTEIEDFSEGIPVSIPVYNRFDNTNINELIIKLTYKGQEKVLNSPSIEPHTRGTLDIHMQEWEPDENITLSFIGKDNNLIDIYKVRLKSEKKIEDSEEQGEAVKIEDTNTLLSVICENNTRIVFNKETGLIARIHKPSDTLYLSGPRINLRSKGKAIMYSYHNINDHDNLWQLKHFDYELDGKQVSIIIQGKYDNSLPVKFKVFINSKGKLRIQYQIENIPREYIREMGIKFELEDVLDSLSWERDAYWSYYPANHLSALKGTAALYPKEQKTFRKEPAKEWIYDSKSFYYEGIENELPGKQLSNIAKSTKENIKEYKLYKSGLEVISVPGISKISCRIAKEDDKILLFVNNETDYIDLSWGNFQQNIMLDREYSNEVILKINTHSNRVGG